MGSHSPDTNGHPCHTIRIILKNGALEFQESRQGTYVLSTQMINGKPSWISNHKPFQAVWYNKKTNDWSIGALKDIGTDYQGIMWKHPASNDQNQF